MPFQMTLWHVQGNALSEVSKSKLSSESRLAEWLANDISLLMLDLLVIGKEVSTINRGRIDLLAIDRRGDLLIIELKRDRTPRDIIAQVLDYASWVRDIDYDRVNEITHDYLGKELPDAFREYFDEPLPETINSAHSMVITP
jgi:RecB family endonuclease NucS